jgi:uncharacterized membrane protein
MGRALSWYGDGWRIFKAKPLTLILSLLLYLAINLGLNIIPLLGGLIAMLISPALIAGLFLLAERTYRQEVAPIGTLFEPLADARTRKPLLILAAISMGLVLLLAVISSLFIGTAAFTGDLATGNPNPKATLDLFSSGSAIIGTFIIFFGSILFGMAIVYAPPLINFQGILAWSAVKLSLTGCLKNILPLLLFGIIGMLMVFLLMVPVTILGGLSVGLFMIAMGLLSLMLGPVFLGAGYSSYLDIFETDSDIDPDTDTASVPRVKTVDRS